MTPQPTSAAAIRNEVTRLLWLWIALLALGALEFGAAFLPLGHLARPLVMIPAIPMIGVVAIGFMNVTQGPPIVRAFAVAALFWLFVLLGLGSVDALTRTDYPVSLISESPHSSRTSPDMAPPEALVGHPPQKLRAEQCCIA